MQKILKVPLIYIVMASNDKEWARGVKLEVSSNTSFDVYKKTEKKYNDNHDNYDKNKVNNNNGEKKKKYRINKKDYIKPTPRKILDNNEKSIILIDKILELLHK